MFSKKSISDLQPTIRSAIDRLFNNFVTAAKQNDVVELRASYLALTTDLICERSFKHTLDLLGSKSRAKQWHHTIGAVVKVIPAARQISWLVPFAMSLPIWLVKQATPALYLLVKFVEVCRPRVHHFNAGILILLGHEDRSFGGCKRFRFLRVFEHARERRIRAL